MTINIHQESILIVDFGSQYTQLIARRVREHGVFSEIFPYDALDKLDLTAYQGIVLAGSPESVTEGESPRADHRLFELGVPVLGICYGMQTMAQQFGGQVSTSNVREFGYARVQVEQSCDLIQGLKDTTVEGVDYLDVWMSHGDKISEVPNDFEVFLSTDSCPIAGIVNQNKRFYGIQFHPEVTHTTQGSEILSRFAKDICGCKGYWTPANIVSEAIESLRSKIGGDQVILGLSGGVDSSVTAALLERAVGDQLTCVFVDNGLLRKNEGRQVMEMFAKKRGWNILKIDAEQEFLNNLSGVADPEKKRKIIGNTFIDVFDREALKLTNAKWLAQGTIYPDVIESAGAQSGKAHIIKSHHNVGGLPEDMKLGLVEPLRELFKDEVRKIGLELDLEPDLIFRHPFPGPGLGVRILGEVRKEYADLLREADSIFIHELREADLYDKVSQAFTVFLPVKSVGVVGDARRYEYVVSLRAVETIDFMTARWAHLPYDFLEQVSNRIINEITGISRVAYDISSKPPATIEWE